MFRALVAAVDTNGNWERRKNEERQAFMHHRKGVEATRCPQAGECCPLEGVRAPKIID